MIVSCGEALVDLVPDPVPGGGPMNVAIAAARLDVPAAFVGRISTDEHGDSIWSHLVANDVELAATERSDEPTATAVVEHVPQLRFRFEGENTADTNLEAVALDRLGPGPHIVHGGTLSLFRGRTAETLASMVESYAGIVSLDPNVRPQIIDDRSEWDRFHQRWLKNASLYKASDEDLEWIWPGRSDDSIAEELLAGGVTVVLCTKGADGAVIFTADGSVDAPGRKVDVVDTVGAGDTFIASVLASLWDAEITDRSSLAYVNIDFWHEVGARAAAAAALTCSRAGADTPRRADLDAFMAQS